MKKTLLCLLITCCCQPASAKDLIFINQVANNKNDAQAILKNELKRDYIDAYQRRGLHGNYYSFYPLIDDKPIFNLVDSIAVDHQQQAFRYYATPMAQGEQLPSWPSNINEPTAEQIGALVSTDNNGYQIVEASAGWWLFDTGLTPIWRALVKQDLTGGEVTSYLIINLEGTSLLTEQGYIEPYQEQVNALRSGNSVDTWLFEPDPKTQLMSTDLEQTQDLTAPLVKAAYRAVSLPDLTSSGDSYQLSGPYARVVDFIEPRIAVELIDADQSSLDYRAPSFVQQMAYYHIDKAQRHLQSLGFKGDKQIHYQPMVIDAQGSSADQSAFSKYQNRILLGTGGIPDGQDADVIWHEYGHSVIHFINPFDSTAQSARLRADSGAIGEGYADFLAAAHSYRDPQGYQFEPNLIFNWDARYGSRRPRTLNDQKAKFNPAYFYPAHITVQGTLGDQLWSTPLFQTLRIAEQKYQQTGAAEFEAVVVEAMYGLGAALTMDTLALSTLDMAKRMYPNRDYSQDLQQAFSERQLLPKFFDIQLAEPISAITGQQEIKATISNLSALSLSNIKLTPSNVDGISLNESMLDTLAAGASETISISAQLAEQLSCGQTISVPMSIGFSSSNPVLNSEQQAFSLVLGQADIVKATGEIGVLKNATSAPSGAFVNKGVSNFTLDLTEDITINDDFKLQLHLRHPNMAELDIKLTSPSGQEVLVWQQDFYPHQEFNFAMPSNIRSLDLTPIKGESVRGQWRLQITDNQANSSDNGEQAALLGWQISQVKTYSCTKPQPPTTPTPPAPVPEQAQSSSGGSSSPTTVISLFLLTLFSLKRLFIKEPK